MIETITSYICILEYFASLRFNLAILSIKSRLFRSMTPDIIFALDYEKLKAIVYFMDYIPLVLANLDTYRGRSLG